MPADTPTPEEMRRVLTPDNCQTSEVIFRVGGCYQHTTGELMRVLCQANTYLYGDGVLIAESPQSTPDFIAVGCDPAHSVNWREISEPQYLQLLGGDNSGATAFDDLSDAEFDQVLDQIYAPVQYVRSSSGATASQIADARLRLTEKQIERRVGRKLPSDWPARDALGDGEC